MGRFAVIRDRDGVVENVVAWDGVTPWSPPPGCSVRPCDAEQDAEPQGRWDGVKFIRAPRVRPDPRAIAAQVVDAQARLDAAQKHAAVPGVAEEIARLQSTLDALLAEAARS